MFESENNNSIATADITYNDYDSYGSISYAGDVDFWKVTFPSEGMVNFYLGNIPSGCNYDMIICVDIIYFKRFGEIDIINR